MSKRTSEGEKSFPHFLVTVPHLRSVMEVRSYYPTKGNAGPKTVRVKFFPPSKTVLLMAPLPFPSENFQSPPFQGFLLRFSLRGFKKSPLCRWPPYSPPSKKSGPPMAGPPCTIEERCRRTGNTPSPPFPYSSPRHRFFPPTPRKQKM